MPEVCISIHGLTKRYKKQAERRGNGRKLHWPRWLASPEEKTFAALDDLSIEIQRGDRVGIIGRNGAGKSTLLKILSRVTVPTEGEVRIRGRLTALLEVGTGFDKNATGRTNIYLNAGLHGLTRQQIDARFDQIVTFSGVGDFLDTPVKHYSSGMYVRLAFAIAAHLEPDILLLDEVLAVGDMAFQQKCLAKVQSLTEDDLRTILFVSHSLGHVAQYCNKVLWLDAGKVRYFGDVLTGIELYSDFMAPKAVRDLEHSKDRKGTGRARITKVTLTDDHGNEIAHLRTGEPVNIWIECRAQGVTDSNAVFLTNIFANERNQRLFGTPTDATGADLRMSSEGGRFRCRIPKFPLLPGVYSHTIGLLIDNQLVDKLEDFAHISVLDGDPFGTGRLPAKQFGDLAIEYQWSSEGR